MNTDQYSKVGKIKDAHGIKGDVYVYIFSGDVSWLKKITEIIICKKNNFQHFKIISSKPHKEGFICKLETFLDRNKAEEYIGCEVWVDSQIFISQDGESLYLKEILGFEVIDTICGSIGVINNFSSNGSQDLLVISDSKTNKDIEIPFVKDFVVKIDYVQKKIHTTLPEGLLSINEPE